MDKTVSCPDQSVSIDFTQLKNLVEGIEQIHKSRGTRTKVFEIEKDIKSWARRVLVIKEDLKKGEFLSISNLTTLRAGVGISSEKFFNYLGRQLNKDVSSGSKLIDEMLL